MGRRTSQNSQLHLCVLNFIYASSTSFMRPQLHLCVLNFIYVFSTSFILPQLFSPCSTFSPCSIFSPCSTFVYQQYGLNLCTCCKTFALCFQQIYHSPLIFRSFFNRKKFTSGEKQVLCFFLFPFPPNTRLLIYQKINVITNRKAEAETKGFEFQCQMQCITELIDVTQHRWSHKRHVTTTLSLSVEFKKYHSRK